MLHPIQMGNETAHFTLNPGTQQPGRMSHLMMGAGRGMGMMGGATAAGSGMAPVNPMMAQQPGGPMMPVMSRMRLEQIRAQNLQQQQQQIRAGGGGVQYPPAPGTGPMMGNPPPPNYRSSMAMNPGEMPPRPGGTGMSTHDASHNVMQRQMQLRHQQMQRKIQAARIQQLQMQQRQRAAMQLAAGGYPAGAQGQQSAMRPAPMQTNPPMPMGHVMHPPQQPQYIQQAPGGRQLIHGAPSPPPYYGQQAQYTVPPGGRTMMSTGPPGQLTFSPMLQQQQSVPHIQQPIGAQIKMPAGPQTPGQPPTSMYPSTSGQPPTMPAGPPPPGQPPTSTYPSTSGQTTKR